MKMRTAIVWREIFKVEEYIFTTQAYENLMHEKSTCQLSGILMFWKLIILVF